jgi:site-specific recombinase XerD
MGTSKGLKKMRAGDVTIEQLATYFQVSNRAEGKSPATLRWYEQNIALFVRYLEDRRHSTAVRDVGLAEAREFIISLQSRESVWASNPYIPTQERHLSSHSINTAVRALRAFFHWLKREGYTTSHKLQDLKVPRVQKKMVDILSKEEIARVLGALNPHTAAGSRDQAIVMVLLDCGLRASELLTLKDRDADTEEGSLRVIGKGNKERIVPIGSRVTKALVQYRHIFRPEAATSLVDTFFLGLDGRQMSFEALKSMLQRLGKRTGVPRLHAHLLRHTFATMFLVNGGDVFTLQRILGHTTLTMVNHYVHMAGAQVVLRHRAFSPMDNMDVTPRRPAPKTVKELAPPRLRVVS